MRRRPQKSMPVGGLLVTLDGSLERFKQNQNWAEQILHCFLEAAAEQIDGLSLSVDAAREPNLAAAETEFRIRQIDSVKRRRFFVSTDVQLDVKDLEHRDLFVVWAYWSTEATISSTRINLFELVDGGEAAEYRMSRSLFEIFINKILDKNLRIPQGWG